MSVANRVISSKYEHPEASWTTTVYVPVDKLLNTCAVWELTILRVSPFGEINVNMYGEVPPATETVIEELEIVTETEKQLVYISASGNYVREAKQSNWATWHNSKEDAVKYLIEKQQSKIDQFQLKIEFCKKDIKKIIELYA